MTDSRSRLADSPGTSGRGRGLQQEVSDLKQKNEFLVMENGKLQQQCDEALAVVNGMENVCAQNKQFASELRLVKTE
jgi:FtsZ-binding cell division protein ZapB